MTRPKIETIKEVEELDIRVQRRVTRRIETTGKWENEIPEERNDTKERQAKKAINDRALVFELLPQNIQTTNKN